MIEEPISVESSTGKTQSAKDFIEHENECRSEVTELNNIFTELKNRLTYKDANDNEIDVDEPDIEGIIRKTEKLIQESGNVFDNISNKQNNLVVRNALSNNDGITNIRKNEDRKCNDRGAGDFHKPNKVGDAPAEKKAPPQRPHSASAAQRGAALLRIRDSIGYDRPAPVRPLRKTLGARYNELREETRDTEERLKNMEMQYASVLEMNRKVKASHDRLVTENAVLEGKLRETLDLHNRHKMEYESALAQNAKSQADDRRLGKVLNELKAKNKSLEFQTLKDKGLIQDLQRQCREMEKILQRKHPDSVSALIVASKQHTFEDPTKEILEKRVEDLEEELKEQEKKCQRVVSALNDQFANLKTKYENHIAEVELQSHNLRGIISELNNRRSKPSGRDVALQVHMANADAQVATKQTQTLSRAGNRLLADVNKLMPGTAMMPSKIHSALRQDGHLLATIKGLQSEIVAKNRDSMRCRRDMEGLRQHIRKLNRERDVLTKVNKTEKMSRQVEVKSMDEINASTADFELYQLRSQKITWEKENDALSERLKATETECKELKEKRIQDLHVLQMAHESELTQMNMKVIPHQENVNRMSSTIVRLQTHVRALEDEMGVVRMERDYLKDQFCLRHVPDASPTRHTNSKPHRQQHNVDLNHLKHKIVELEQKHEARELRLKTLGSTLNKLTSSANPSVTTLNSDRKI